MVVIMNKRTFRFAFIVTNLLASNVHGAVHVWTGLGGDNEWTNALNWSGNAVPGTSPGDSVLFTNDTPLSIRVTDANGNFTGRFEGKDVTFAPDPGSSKLFFFSGYPTCEIFVAEGTVVTVSNTLHRYHAAAECLKKTGKGVLRIVGPSGGNDGNVQVVIPSLDVCEGEYQGVVKEGADHGVYLTDPTNVIVRSGAVFYHEGYNALSKNTVYNLESNAVMRLHTGWGSDTVASVCGDGRVEAVVDSRSNPAGVPLKMSFLKEPAVFSGRFGEKMLLSFEKHADAVEQNRRFVVGAKETLADAAVTDYASALFFASDVGSFLLNRYVAPEDSMLRLCDTAGGDICVAVTNGVVVSKSLTIEGGGEGTVSSLAFDSEEAQVRLKGGTLMGQKTIPSCKEYADSVLAVPDFMPIDAGKTGKFRVEGGCVYLSNKGDGTFGRLSELYLAGGRCIVAGGFLPPEDGTASIVLDGGTFACGCRNSANWYRFPNDSGENISICVGANGGRIEACDLPGYHQDSHRLRFTVPFDSGCEEGDGGLICDLRRTGQGIIFYRPLNLTGGLAVLDGRLCLDFYNEQQYADLATHPAWFGTGSVLLEGSMIDYMKSGGSLPGGILKLASGQGSTFGISGSSAIRFRASSESAAQHIVIGPENVGEGSAFVRRRGGALFLSDANHPMDGTGSSLKVNGGIPTHAATGLSRIPAFSERGEEVHFLRYDTEKGFVEISEESTSLDAGSDAVLLANGISLATGRSAHVAALRLSGWQSLTVEEGSRLTVGNGVDPACLILGKQTSIKGTGTLDFGSSEGVIALGLGVGDSIGDWHGISCEIAGSGGVSYVTFPGYGHRAVTLTAGNTYSGETHVSAAGIVVRHGRAFSDGDVFVDGGWRNGGKLMFDRPLELENNLHVSGAGHRLAEWNSTLGGYGALSFLTNGVVLSGAVELTSATMVSAQNADASGTFKGTVSGDRLIVYPGEGRVVLAAQNTYTGGTEVVRSTLVLSGTEPSVGSGCVSLDNGVLRFENTEPMVFTNRVEGVGRIELAGAPVAFPTMDFAALPVKSLAAGTVLDYPAFEQTDLVVAVGEDGLDLGGRDFTVLGVSGSGRISGGVLTVTGRISPGGDGTVGTLVFERPPVLSQVVYVCDYTGDGADRIVLEESMDISSMSISVIARSDARELIDATVLSCAQGVSGSFAAYSLPAAGYALIYQKNDVKVRSSTSLKIIIR